MLASVRTHSVATCKGVLQLEAKTIAFEGFLGLSLSTQTSNRANIL